MGQGQVSRELGGGFKKLQLKTGSSLGLGWWNGGLSYGGVRTAAIPRESLWLERRARLNRTGSLAV